MLAVQGRGNYSVRDIFNSKGHLLVEGKGHFYCNLPYCLLTVTLLLRFYSSYMATGFTCGL